MELSKRLIMIASHVEEGKSVADIGTDHGYIPIYLSKKGISPYTIAMDVNKDPLVKALHNAQAYHVADKVDTRLSNGFEELKPGEVDTVIIAGMGGKLIEEILEKAKDKVKTYESLILSPHKDLESVRRKLYDIGLCITDEDMLYDEGHFYTIITAKPCAVSDAPSDIDYKYGRLLIDKKHPVLMERLHESIDKKKKIVMDLREKNILTRASQLQKEIEEEEKVLKWLI